MVPWLSHGGRPGRREGAGLDLNAVLLDLWLRFVFRFGRKAQENRQNETKHKTKNETKNTVEVGP